jgi:predicted RND superfamily exporter protein
MSEFLVRRKLVAILVGLLLFFGLLSGVRKIELENDYRAFIGENNPILQNTDWLSERQGDGGDAAILLYVPASGRMFDGMNLLQYSHVATEAKNLPYTQTTKSMFDQEKLIRISGQGGEVQYGAAGFMAGMNVFDDEGARKLERLATTLPNISGRFVARDAATSSVIITLDFAADDLPRREQIDRLMSAVDTLEEELQDLQPGDQLYLAGSAFFDHAASALLLSEARNMFPIVLIFVFGALFFVYRSFFFALVSLVLVVLPVLATAGLAGHLGLEISNLSITGLLLVGTLAVADVLHISNTYFLRRAQEEDPDTALKNALRLNFRAVWATTFTTVIGQCAILFSPAEPIRNMGWIVVLGAWLALVFAWLMLPASLYLLRARSKTTLTFLSGFIGKIGYASARNARAVIAVFLAIGAASLWGASNTRMHDSLVDWFSEETEFNRGLTLLDKGYLGGDTVFFSVQALPEDVVAANRLHEEGVAVQVFQDLNIRLQADFDGYWYSIPAVGEAVRTLMQSGPADGLDFTEGDLSIGGASRFSSEVVARSGLMTRYQPGRTDYSIWSFDGESASSFDIVAQTRQAEAVIRDAVGSRDVRTSGIGYAISVLSVENYWAVIQGSILTFIVISATMFLVLKSIGLGALSIVPNALPLIATLGLWGALAGDLNLAAITVFSVVLGIIIDDTIHIMLKCQAALATDPENPFEAVRHALTECGAGVVMTTVIIGFGFALLGTSDFLLTAQRSQMAAAAVFLGLLFDLILLPALIVAWHRQSRGSSAPSRTAAPIG